MRVFKSKILGLRINVGGQIVEFKDGRYETDLPHIIAALEKNTNVMTAVEVAQAKVEEKSDKAAEAIGEAKEAEKELEEAIDREVDKEESSIPGPELPDGK